MLVICHLAGFDVLGWFSGLWDTMTEISLQYIVAGVFFQTIQTTLTALSWYFILRPGTRTAASATGTSSPPTPPAWR